MRYINEIIESYSIGKGVVFHLAMKNDSRDKEYHVKKLSEAWGRMQEIVNKNTPLQEIVQFLPRTLALGYGVLSSPLYAIKALCQKSK